MSANLTKEEELLVAFKELDPRALTRALCNEAWVVRTFSAGTTGFEETDRLMKLIRYYLDGKATVDECLTQRKVLLEELEDAPGGIDRQKLAFHCYKRAWALIPLTADEWNNVYEVLSEIDSFTSYWAPGINWEQIYEARYLRLQVVLQDNAWRALVLIPEGRSRISGLTA